ncbi:MAG TPA: hypothetical protein VFF57_13205, partial [Hanamia sp.]|nr:hypothetical protein [Hanamia sp.]
MHTIYKIFFLIAIFFTARNTAYTQVTQDSLHRATENKDSIPSVKDPVPSIKDSVPPVKDSVPSVSSTKDTVPSSVNVELENIFNAKAPKQYTISHITVTGTTFDPNLIISISGLTVGGKVILPGSDDFANAITNLWKQNLVSDVDIYLTDLKGSDLSIEIHVTDRPVLSNFKFKGISKTESDDLSKKLDIKKGRVTRVTEGFKVSAITTIKKFFIDKGFRNVEVTISES